MTPELHAALVEKAKRERARRKQRPNADMSLRGRLRDNFIGVDDGVTSFGERAAQFLNKAGESATMGLVGDETAAAADALIGRGTYEERRDFYREQERALEREKPGLALTAEIGGALLPALIPGAQAFGIARSASLPVRMAQSAATAGAMGATYGFMEGDEGDRGAEGLQTGALSAAIGSMIPFVGSGVSRAIHGNSVRRGVREAAKKGGTTSEGMTRANALYDDVKNAGVEVKGEAIDRLRSGIEARLLDETAFSTRPGARSAMPQTSGLVSDMAQASGEMGQHANPGLPFRELEGFRRQAGGAAGNFAQRSDTKGGVVAIEEIDDFVRNLSQDDVLAGDYQALPGLITKAREAFSTAAKSRTIDDAIEASESYLSGPGRGIKYQFKRILKNKKLSRGFSEAEKAAMRRVINGTFPEKILETMGSGLTQIGGLVGGFGAALSTGNPAAAGVGMLAMLGGKGARALSDDVILRNAEQLRKAVASGALREIPPPAPPTLLESLGRRATAVGIQ